MASAGCLPACHAFNRAWYISPPSIGKTVHDEIFYAAWTIPVEEGENTHNMVMSRCELEVDVPLGGAKCFDGQFISSLKLKIFVNRARPLGVGEGYWAVDTDGDEQSTKLTQTTRLSRKPSEFEANLKNILTQMKLDAKKNKVNGNLKSWNKEYKHLRG